MATSLVLLKRPKRPFLLRHDNATPQSVHWIHELLQSFQWKFLRHLPYCTILGRGNDYSWMDTKTTAQFPVQRNILNSCQNDVNALTSSGIWWKVITELHFSSNKWATLTAATTCNFNFMNYGALRIELSSDRFRKEYSTMDASDTRQTIINPRTIHILRSNCCHQARCEAGTGWSFRPTGRRRWSAKLTKPWIW